jgi:aryl sulfotransferase
MQQIVSLLLSGSPSPRSLPHLSPWIDARFRDLEPMLDALARQTSRRFLKTHVPADGLPLYDEVTYIHVARDGRDALMSMHNHFTGFSEAQLAEFDRIGLADPTLGAPYPRLPSDPAEFFRLWLSTATIEGQSDGLPGLSFFDFEAGYWAERRRANMLLVHYDDMLTDLDGEMRRIAAFLGILVDPEHWDTLVAAATFASMKAVGGELMPQTKAMFVEGPSRFFHRGTNGRWRNVLCSVDLAHYDAKVRAKFTPALAAWVQGGRAAAGEPATVGD